MSTNGTCKEYGMRLPQRKAQTWWNTVFLTEERRVWLLMRVDVRSSLWADCTKMFGDQSASLPEEDIETGVFWQLSLSQKSIFGNVTATKQWRSVKLEQFFAFSEVGVNPGTIRWQFAKFAENHRDWLGYEPEIFDVRLLRTDLTFIYYWSSFVSRAAPRGECMGCHGNSFCRRTLLFCFIQCAWLFSLSFVLVSTLHRRWRIWRIADVPRSF